MMPIFGFIKIIEGSEHSFNIRFIAAEP